MARAHAFAMRVVDKTGEQVDMVFALARLLGRLSLVGLLTKERVLNGEIQIAWDL